MLSFLICTKCTEDVQDSNLVIEREKAQKREDKINKITATIYSNANSIIPVNIETTGNIILGKNNYCTCQYAWTSPNIKSKCSWNNWNESNVNGRMAKVNMEEIAVNEEEIFNIIDYPYEESPKKGITPDSLYNTVNNSSVGNSIIDELGESANEDNISRDKTRNIPNGDIKDNEENMFIFNELNSNDISGAKERRGEQEDIIITSRINCLSLPQIDVYSKSRQCNMNYQLQPCKDWNDPLIDEFSEYEASNKFNHLNCIEECNSRKHSSTSKSAYWSVDNIHKKIKSDKFCVFCEEIYNDYKAKRKEIKEMKCKFCDNMINREVYNELFNSEIKQNSFLNRRFQDNVEDVNVIEKKVKKNSDEKVK